MLYRFLCKNSWLIISTTFERFSLEMVNLKNFERRGLKLQQTYRDFVWPHKILRLLTALREKPRSRHARKRIKNETARPVKLDDNFARPMVVEGLFVTPNTMPMLGVSSWSFRMVNTSKKVAKERETNNLSSFKKHFCYLLPVLEKEKCRHYFDLLFLC